MFLKLVVKCVCECRLSTQFSNNSCQSTKYGHDEKYILSTQKTTYAPLHLIIYFSNAFKLGAHS